MSSGLGMPRGGTVSSVRSLVQMGAASYERVHNEYYSLVMVRFKGYYH